MEEMGLNNTLFNEAVPLAVTPPWLFPLVLVDLIYRSRDYRNITNMSGIIEDSIMTVYNEYTAVYTDGSKSMETGKMGFGVFVPELRI